MKEGDVVMVVGKLDDRVRDTNPEAGRIGTVVAVTKEDVIVLLPNGDLWKGNHWNVVRQEEERIQSDSGDA